MKKKIYEKPETQVLMIQTSVLMSSGPTAPIAPAAVPPIFDADVIADYGDDSYEGDDSNGKIENFHGYGID